MVIRVCNSLPLNANTVVFLVHYQIPLNKLRLKVRIVKVIDNPPPPKKKIPLPPSLLSNIVGVATRQIANRAVVAQIVEVLLSCKSMLTKLTCRVMSRLAFTFLSCDVKKHRQEMDSSSRLRVSTSFLPGSLSKYRGQTNGTSEKEETYEVE